MSCREADIHGCYSSRLQTWTVFCRGRASTWHAEGPPQFSPQQHLQLKGPPRRRWHERPSFPSAWDPGRGGCCWVGRPWGTSLMGEDSVPSSLERTWNGPMNPISNIGQTSPESPLCPDTWRSVACAHVLLDSSPVADRLTHYPSWSVTKHFSSTLTSGIKPGIT